jgi:dolichyl-phosphate-mannose--protein O-mannosyl transferase
MITLPSSPYSDQVTVVELRGSRLDDAWDRWMLRPGMRRLWQWGAPAVVVATASVLRLVNVGHPHQLVFDETYYVKDAYTLWNLGYEGAWPANANEDFNAGATDNYTTDPAFVAHPPLGKWLISLGLAAFGAENSFGWRLSTALVGILLVVVTMLIAHRLFRSTLLTVIAGGLLAIDGNAIVLSRVSLLDSHIALLALVGAYFVLLDRTWSDRRLRAWLAARESRGLPTDWGPVLWWRPWLIAAALLFGLASATKWNGVFFLAGFGLYSVISDVFLRHRAGVTFYVSGTVIRQGPASLLLMVPLAIAVYVTSWTGWFATAGGYYRHWVEGGGKAAEGLLSWVPLDVQNWWHYQMAILNYAANEHTPHGYQANPLTWLFLIRPTSMYYESFPDGSVATILDIANPLIWWAGTAAIGFCLYRVISGLIKRRRVWVEAFILTGVAAGYLPWMFYLNRTVFQFYTIVFEPYLILALTAAIAFLLGSRNDLESRRVAGLRTVALFLGLCLVLSAFFLPVWTGMEVSNWFMRLHFWLPTWI